VETFLMKIKHATIALNTGEGFAAHDISADIRRDVTDADIHAALNI
jgi:hypothetical protein